MNKTQETLVNPGSRLAKLLELWSLTGPLLVAERPTSQVWRVQRRNGDLAALKLTRPDKGQSEAGSGAVLRAWNGDGAVRLLETAADAQLLEWLGGRSLGDVSREGRDIEATRDLASLAARLHRRPIAAIKGLPSLDQWCHPLSRFDPVHAPTENARHDVVAAQGLLIDLLASRNDDRALHGDLHHDNVVQSSRGWLAIDPKGLNGELAFETANAFRNPVGDPDVPAKPERIADMADAFAEALDVDRSRVLRWAAAKCALSIAWGFEDAKGPGADWHLLTRLLDSASA